MNQVRQAWIIATSILLIGVFPYLFQIDATAIESLKEQCDEMMLGDNWTLGYHNETVQKCCSYYSN